jgi:hypothetical protein
MLATCADTERHVELGANCVVLPGSFSSLSRSYRVQAGGRLEVAGEATGGAGHVRAAFHPDRHTLYVNSVGPGWWVSEGGDTSHAGVRVRAYLYDPSDCSVGPLLGSAGFGSDQPSSERAYGLQVHPTGRYLYQTTASLKEIRLYDIGDDRVPVPREAYDATNGRSVVCAQIRRLLVHPSGGHMFANCNNADAGAGVDHALQVWVIAEDGSLSLEEHHVLEAMDSGVLDPVLHPSGNWLYQPLGTSDTNAPEGAGAYILVFRVNPDGGLTLGEQVPIRVIVPGDSVSDPTNTQVFPMTIALDSTGTTAYVALHVILGWQTFPHEFAVYRIRDGGRTLVEAARLPALRKTTGSSHHGGTLARAGDDLFFYSYLTDYDTIAGGVIQQLRVVGADSLEPLEPAWIETGLIDGRQLIPVR